MQDALAPEVISKMIVKDLKDELGRRNLNKQGKKAGLLSRLLNSVTNVSASSSSRNAVPDQLSVPTLLGFH